MPKAVFNPTFSDDPTPANVLRSSRSLPPPPQTSSSRPTEAAQRPSRRGFPSLAQWAGTENDGVAAPHRAAVDLHRDPGTESSLAPVVQPTSSSPMHSPRDRLSPNDDAGHGSPPLWGHVPTAAPDEGHAAYSPIASSAAASTPASMRTHSVTAAAVSSALASATGGLVGGGLAVLQGGMVTLAFEDLVRLVQVRCSSVSIPSDHVDRG